MCRRLRSQVLARIRDDGSVLPGLVESSQLEQGVGSREPRTSVRGVVGDYAMVGGERLIRAAATAAENTHLHPEIEQRRLLSESGLQACEGLRPLTRRRELQRVATNLDERDQSGGVRTASHEARTPVAHDVPERFQSFALGWRGFTWRLCCARAELSHLVPPLLDRCWMALRQIVLLRRVCHAGRTAPRRRP